MHNENSMKRALTVRAKKILEKTGYLTARQIDMAIVAILSLPYSLASDMIDRIEQDPTIVTKEIQIPGKRY